MMSAGIYRLCVGFTLIACVTGGFFVSAVLSNPCPGGWSEEFETLPSDWKVKGKPGTKNAEFFIEKSEDGSESWLGMRADNATATFAVDLDNIDLTKTPILKWRWRVTVFPTGADGRDSDKDDQAIGIYISEGSRFKQKSLAYRWETETPAGEEGSAKYGMGVVTVKWIGLRDKNDADGMTFIEEERNLADDFKKAFGSIPKKINLGISCNSQYTKSKAEAQLDWIRLCPDDTTQKSGESALEE
jgi:hypothetical protein